MQTKTAAKATAKHLARRTFAIRVALSEKSNRTTSADYFERLADYAELLRDRIEVCAEVSPAGTKNAVLAARTVAASARRDADYAREMQDRYAF